jgi:hypothetical protein
MADQKTELNVPWAPQIWHLVYIYRGSTAVAFAEKAPSLPLRILKVLILLSPLKVHDQNLILTLCLLPDFKIISIYLSIISIHLLSLIVLLFRLRAWATDTLKFLFLCVCKVLYFWYCEKYHKFIGKLAIHCYLAHCGVGQKCKVEESLVHREICIVTWTSEGVSKLQCRVNKEYLISCGSVIELLVIMLEAFVWTI